MPVNKSRTTPGSAALSNTTSHWSCCSNQRHAASAAAGSSPSRAWANPSRSASAARSLIAVSASSAATHPTPHQPIVGGVPMSVLDGQLCLADATEAGQRDHVLGGQLVGQRGQL